MRLLRVICSLISLVLVINVSSEVYDDEGKIITEDEIKNEMKDTYKLGCTIAGYTCAGILGSVGVLWCFLAYVAPVMVTEMPSDEMPPSWVIATLVISPVIPVVSWMVGKNIDKREAIKRIKEQRLNQRQDLSDTKKSFAPDLTISISLLSGNF